MRLWTPTITFCSTVIVREERQVLEGAADAEAGDAMRRHGEQRPAVKLDLSAAGNVEPAHAVEERRLAGAVGADEADDLALADVEGHAVQGHDAAEPDGDVAHDEKRARQSAPVISRDRAPDGTQGRRSRSSSRRKRSQGS